MFKDSIKKGVTGVVAGAGTYLAAWGIVPADVWASLSPDLVAGVSATVGVVVAGVWNYAVTWAMGKVASVGA